MRSRSLPVALRSIPLPIVALAAVLSSCAPPPAPPLAVRVTWAEHDGAALPDGVAELEIVTCVRRDAGDECESARCSVAALQSGSSEDCRPPDGADEFGDAPVLVRSDLPTGVPIRFELRARSEAGRLSHLGLAGPLILGDGERRFVELHMYPVGPSRHVEGAGAARFLHTTTALADGRVLIAGGFVTAGALEACPGELGLPEGSKCFALAATDEALAFDVATATVTPVRHAMLAPRAGHTATALPDGRVLIAGGATHGLLALIAQGPDALYGYALSIFARDAAGREAAHASYELFDPFADTDDPERDGDPGRGRFFGPAGEAAAGALHQPRFRHAAAADRARPDRVLLIGGSGGLRSAETYELFDNRKPGGFGVHAATANRLRTPRALPSAVGLDSGVWIFGGALADDDAELAEVWRASDSDPNGATLEASSLPASQFPSSIAGVPQSRPEYSLARPHVGAIGGQRALVVGWYGPQCAAGTNMPIFDPPGAETVHCDASPGGMPRSFSVDARSGVAAPAHARSHAFGSFVELTVTDRIAENGQPRRFWAIAGGAGNLAWGAQSSIDVFTEAPDGIGAPDRVAEEPTLDSPRLLHDATAIPSAGMVTVGGIAFGAALDRILFVPEIEVAFLPG